MARARGAAHGAHDDLRDRGGRARERPTAVTAGSGISARRAKTAEYWSPRTTGGWVRRDELVRPPAPYSYPKESVARDGGPRRSQADRWPRDQRRSLFQRHRHLLAKPRRARGDPH